ncbi:MAG: tRNA lysidine(34) synthetase TilS [Lawsonibacter sp.]|nr:tRNA lysidine(34) synthetase TilS [Lawsonibacter sp.]
MLGAMEQLIRDLHLLQPGSTILCAVSGGADSVCLLHSLYHLRPKLGFHLAAAHYNHMLRGDESDQDAVFVEQFTALCCGQQRLADGSILPAVPLFSGCGDVGAEAKRRGTGLEETARNMRYSFLRQAAKEAGADCIATAHTADDNVETILFHLARGTGLRGMTGIPPVRDDLIRPLLTTTRHEIDAYLSYYGLPHREDHTNSDDVYARNRIRHQVVPVLENLCPGFAARVASTAALLRSDEDCLSAQARAISQHAVFLEDALSISAALIGTAPDPVASRAVRQLIGQFNGGDQDCVAAHLEAVVRLCRGSDPSAQTHLPYGMTAHREYQQLILTRDAAVPHLEETFLPLPGETAVGGWCVSCTAETYYGQPQGPYEFWLDLIRTGNGLTLRSRRTGDRLKLPRRPEKTVKKWCIDEKVPARLRPALPVLEWDGQLAAAVGLGPAETFLPRTGTEAWHISIKARSI